MMRSGKSSLRNRLLWSRRRAHWKALSPGARPNSLVPDIIPPLDGFGSGTADGIGFAGAIGGWVARADGKAAAPKGLEVMVGGGEAGAGTLFRGGSTELTVFAVGAEDFGRGDGADAIGGVVVLVRAGSKEPVSFVGGAEALGRCGGAGAIAVRGGGDGNF